MDPDGRRTPPLRRKRRFCTPRATQQVAITRSLGRTSTADRERERERKRGGRRAGKKRTKIQRRPLLSLSAQIAPRQPTSTIKSRENQWPVTKSVAWLSRGATAFVDSHRVLLLKFLTDLYVPFLALPTEILCGLQKSSKEKVERSGDA